MSLYKGHWVLLPLIGCTFRYKISPHFRHLGERHISFPLRPSGKKSHLSGRDDIWWVYPTRYIRWFVWLHANLMPSIWLVFQRISVVVRALVRCLLLPSPEVRDVLHIIPVTLASAHFTQSVFWTPENTAVTGETLDRKYPPWLFTSRQHLENKCETPLGSRKVFPC